MALHSSPSYLVVTRSSSDRRRASWWARQRSTETAAVAIVLFCRPRCGDVQECLRVSYSWGNFSSYTMYYTKLHVSAGRAVGSTGVQCRHAIVACQGDAPPGTTHLLLHKGRRGRVAGGCAACRHTPLSHSVPRSQSSVTSAALPVRGAGGRLAARWPLPRCGH